MIDGRVDWVRVHVCAAARPPPANEEI